MEFIQRILESIRKWFGNKFPVDKYRIMQSNKTGKFYVMVHDARLGWVYLKKNDLPYIYRYDFDHPSIAEEFILCHMQHCELEDTVVKEIRVDA